MRKLSYIIIVLFVGVYLVGCSDKQEHQAVIGLIDALPSVVTLDDEEAIIAVREAYDALGESQKEKVTNIATLIDLEEQLSILKISLISLEIQGPQTASLGDVLLTVVKEPINHVGEVLWEVLTPNLASITQSGLLTIIDYGTVEVNASIGSIVATYTVSVEKPMFLVIEEAIGLLNKQITLEDELFILEIQAMLDNISTEEQQQISNLNVLENAVTALEQLRFVDNATIVAPSQAALGDEFVLLVHYLENLYPESILWNSSDTDVAVINDAGVVQIVGSGAVLITAKLENNVELSHAITVIAPSAMEEVLWWLAFHYEKITIDNNIELPVKHPKIDATIEWIIFDEHLITKAGVYTAPPVDETIYVIAEVRIAGVRQEIDLEWLIKGFGTKADAIELWLMTQVPTRITTNIYLPIRHFRYGGSITWSSSNTDIISNNGTYFRPDNDTTILLYYEIIADEETIQGSIEVVVAGKSDMLKATEILEEFDVLYQDIGIINEDIYLATTSKYTHYDYIISWRSSNEGVVSPSGVFTAPLYDQAILLIVTVSVGDASVTSVYSAFASGYTFSNKWDAVEVFLGNIYRERISNQRFILYGHEAGYEYVPAQNIGYIPFYDHNDANVIVDLLPLSNANRPGIIKQSTEYVTIHNTGMAHPTATAELLNRAIRNSSASWHYSIDDIDIYQHVPLDEVAYHAGDGSRQFIDTDSGVYANGKENPVVTISVDGYYVLDGFKTTISAPTLSNRLAVTSDINRNGIRVVIGNNGNWFIGNTYYNSTYLVIANAGGNRNSVGIEMAVYAGIDFNQAMRNSAKVTAELLIRYGLGFDRIKQHYDFSGKNCPQVLRQGNRWEEFINLVRIEYFAKVNLQNVTFTWLSLSPTMLNNNGSIVFHPGYETTVSYQVSVTYNQETRIYTFESILEKLD